MVNTYKTSGTCSRSISFEVEDNKIKSLSFEGGCNGNLQGISRLCLGKDIDEIIEKLGSIRCGMKPTSCPDQLARALTEYKNRKR